MASASSAAAKKESIDDIVSAAVHHNRAASTSATVETTAKTEDAKFAKIEANPFYQILFAQELSNKEKKAEVAKALVFEGTKEENRARIGELELFKEWLQQQRRQWALNSLKLADEEVFSEMQAVFTEMNQGIVDFNNAVAPLVEMLEGLNDLRLQGKVLDAYQEIQGDQEEDQRRQRILAEQTAKGKQLLKDKEDAERQIANLKLEKKVWILGGGLKKEAAQGIAQREIDIQQTDAKIAALEQQVVTTQQDFEQTRASALGDDPKIAKAKLQLRELLETPPEVLNERQKALKASVMNFINNIDKRTSSALVHLQKQGDQCVNMLDSSSTMRNIYAIVNDATKDATDTNKTIYDGIKGEVAGTESEIDKMALEEKRTAIEDHITVLGTTQRETIDTLSELTGEQMRVRAMQDATKQQVQKVTQLHNSGNAGMASRLLTVYNGVSQAASHESAESVWGSIEHMKGSTSNLLQKGILANSMGLGEENERRLKAIIEMEDSAKVMQAASEITQNNLSDLRKSDQELQARAAELKQQVEGYASLAAEMRDAGGEPTLEKHVAAAKSTVNPFKLG